MRYILEHLEEIKKRYDNGRDLLIAAHLDGVLVPYMENPSEIVIEDHLRELLNSLANKTRFSLALISGRQLDFLKLGVNIKNIYYVGNHGLEIESDIMRFTAPQAKKASPEIQNIKNKVTAAVEKNSNIFLENKMLSFSVHCKKGAEGERCVREAEKLVFEKVKNRRDVAVIKRGAEVEVRPKAALDSGDALNWILRNREGAHASLFPLVIANPFSDGHACRVANDRNGFSAVIGQNHGETGAQFYFNNQQEVNKLLESLSRW